MTAVCTHIPLRGAASSAPSTNPALLGFAALLPPNRVNVGRPSSSCASSTMLPPPMTTTRRAPTPSYGWARTLPRPPPSSPLPVTTVAFLIRDWLACNPAALAPRGRRGTQSPSRRRTSRREWASWGTGSWRVHSGAGPIPGSVGRRTESSSRAWAGLGPWACSSLDVADTHLFHCRSSFPSAHCWASHRLQGCAWTHRRSPRHGPAAAAFSAVGAAAGPCVIVGPAVPAVAPCHRRCCSALRHTCRGVAGIGGFVGIWGYGWKKIGMGILVHTEIQNTKKWFKTCVKCKGCYVSNFKKSCSGKVINRWVVMVFFKTSKFMMAWIQLTLKIIKCISTIDA